MTLHFLVLRLRCGLLRATGCLLTRVRKGGAHEKRHLIPLERKHPPHSHPHFVSPSKIRLLPTSFGMHLSCVSRVPQIEVRRRRRHFFHFLPSNATTASGNLIACFVAGDDSNCISRFLIAAVVKFGKLPPETSTDLLSLSMSHPNISLLIH